MAKTLEKYSQEDLKAWVDNLDPKIFQPDAKADIKKAITEYEIEGDDLVDVQDKNNLKKLGFPSYISKKLWKSLQTIPRKQTNDDNKEGEIDDELEDVLNNKGNNNDKSKKYVIKFTIGTKNKTTVNQYSLDDYVCSLLEEIREHQGGEPGKLKLIFLGKELDPYKTLRQSGFTAQTVNADVTVGFSVKGGASLSEDEKESSRFYKDENRIRKPDWNERRITPTRDADCIMGYDDKKTIRVKMPCNHVFDPLTLFRIAKMTIENFSKSDWYCPVDNCNTIWPFEVVAAACDMDSNEIRIYSQIILNRKAIQSGDFQQCKQCKALIRKPKNIEMKRLRCTNKDCKSGDFCGLCGELWKGGGFIVCGNDNCQSNKINNALKAAKMINPSGRPDKQCPNLRACPRCWAIIKYEEKCKHMRCGFCNKQFCFMCLSLQKDDGSWDCIGGDWHKGQCPPHDPQILK